VSDLFTDPFFPGLLKGITFSSNELGYDVTLWLGTRRKDHHDFYANAFNNSLIDGLIIASATFDSEFLSWLRHFTKPFAFVGAAPPSMPNITYVDIDNEKGAELAINHLLEQGCRRIGMIEGRSKQIASDQRREGYLAALEQAGIPVDYDLIIPNGNYVEHGGYECMQQLLAKNVDGVFAANDMMALGALRAIREAGLDVPKDIAVIGFDGVPYAALSNPPLSTISQPIGLLGAETTKALIDLLENDPPEVTHKVLPVELVVRESTARTVKATFF
jgi:LacI family transcriptional regulator